MPGIGSVLSFHRLLINWFWYEDIWQLKNIINFSIFFYMPSKNVFIMYNTLSLVQLYIFCKSDINAKI